MLRLFSVSRVKKPITCRLREAAPSFCCICRGHLTGIIQDGVGAFCHQKSWRKAQNWNAVKNPAKLARGEARQINFFHAFGFAHARRGDLAASQPQKGLFFLSVFSRANEFNKRKLLLNFLPLPFLQSEIYPPTVKNVGTGCPFG